MSDSVSRDIEKTSLAPCPYCGAAGMGGYEGCSETLEKIMARFLGRPGFSYFYATQRALVDCYGLQHPEIHCVSVESYASHLAGICVFLLYDGRRYIYNAVERWLMDAGELVRPETPEFRGKMTITDLLDVKDPPDLQSRVSRWAEDVWSAYANMHNLAFTCVELAMERG